jgi:hypothetical protein
MIGKLSLKHILIAAALIAAAYLIYTNRYLIGAKITS